MKYFSKVLTFDVGENTAFSFWEGKPTPEIGQFTSKNYYLLLDLFDATILRYFPEKVYIEDAEMMGIMTTAANERFVFLTKLVGGYTARCASHSIKCETVSVKKWKGQLKDRQVAKWIFEATGQSYNSPHVRSAVGIGLYKMGHF